MVIHYIWRNANPNYESQLRRANEARAAAFYAGWRRLAGALGSVFRRGVEAWRRAARARRTEAALSALSDRHLRDIGLERGEIRSIARMVAEEPAGATLADLRPLRSAYGTGYRGAASGESARRARPAAWAAKKPAREASQQRAA